MLKESFLSYLRFERNYSDKTIRSYGIDLEKFEEYLKGVNEELALTDVDADLVRGWVLSLMEQGYATTSVNRKLSSLRSFYNYLLRRGMLSVNPMLVVKGPKNKKPLPVFVRDEEMTHLLDNTEWKTGFEGLRNRLIVEVFYVTGIRLSELIGMADKDVDFSAQVIKVTGKRNKQRIIPFGNELKEDMMAYLDVRDKEVSGYSEAFFVRKDGKCMYPRMVYLLVRQSLSKVVTLKKRSPHVLRHTFATSMLNNGAELGAVKELLGHESLMTTEVYTHTTFEELKKVYKQAHPRA